MLGGEMKHICAWCGAELAPPDGKNDHLTTHGICDACAEAETAKMREGVNPSPTDYDFLKSGEDYGR